MKDPFEYDGEFTQFSHTRAARGTLEKTEHDDRETEIEAFGYYDEYTQFSRTKAARQPLNPIDALDHVVLDLEYWAIHLMSM